MLKFIRSTLGVMVLVLFSAFGVMANETPSYKYEVDLESPMIARTITFEVCETVGYMASGVKRVIDLGADDKTIKHSLTANVLENLDDDNTWIAYSYLMENGLLADMRSWVDAPNYKRMVEVNPSYTAEGYYQLYGQTFCNAHVNRTLKVLNIKRTKRDYKFDMK